MLEEQNTKSLVITFSRISHSMSLIKVNLGSDNAVPDNHWHLSCTGDIQNNATSLVSHVTAVIDNQKQRQLYMLKDKRNYQKHIERISHNIIRLRAHSRCKLIFQNSPASDTKYYRSPSSLVTHILYHRLAVLVILSITPDHTVFCASFAVFLLSHRNVCWSHTKVEQLKLLKIN